MDYSVTFENVDYELPAYDFKIADKIEVIKNSRSKTLRERCKKIYEFCGELIGKAKVAEILGNFNESDPNRIQILWQAIINAYDDPLVQSQYGQVKERVESTGIADIAKIMDKVVELEKRIN